MRDRNRASAGRLGFVLLASSAVLSAAPRPAPDFTVLFFTAPWCGPCRAVHSALERIARANPGRIRLVTLDFDSAVEENRRWEVREIPDVIVIARDGRILMRATGGDRDTVRGLETGLANLLKPSQRRRRSQ